jgi:hypothetical protein
MREKDRVEKDIGTKRRRQESYTDSEIYIGKDRKGRDRSEGRQR